MGNAWLDEDEGRRRYSTDYETGKIAERAAARILAARFRGRYRKAPVDLDKQTHADFLLDDQRLAVHYEGRAWETSNVAVEVQANIDYPEDYQPWIDCSSHLFWNYIPQWGLTLCAVMSVLRAQKDRWLEEYETRPIENRSESGELYTAEIVLVPVWDYVGCCSRVILDEGARRLPGMPASETDIAGWVRWVARQPYSKKVDPRRWR